MHQARERIGASAWWMALPFLAALWAYSPVLSGGFVWDDHALIENHPQVKTFAPLSSYFTRRFWSDPLDNTQSFYRPLITLSYAVEWKLWSGRPAGFHATNLVAHLAVVALLLLLCQRGGAKGLAAAAPVAVFAVLPRLTESVAWISGRTDVLASVCGLAALLVYRPAPGWSRPLGCAALLALGLLCKEVAAAYLAALVVLEWSEGRRFTKASVRRLGPACAAAVLALLARSFAMSAAVPPTSAAGPLPAWPERLLTVFAALGSYVVMMADAFRPRLQIGFVGDPPLLLAVVGGGLVIAVGLAVRRLRSKLSPLQLAFGAAFAVGLAMVIHIVPLNMPVLAADRFLYVPVAACVVCCAPALQRITLRAPWTVAIAALVLVSLLAARTQARVHVWNDEYALWSTAVAERHPRNTGPLLALAGVLLDASLPERALVVLERQLEIERSAPQLKTLDTYAVAQSRAGRHEPAIALLEDIARQRPDALRARLNLAMSDARAGRWEDADRVLVALAGHPDVGAVAAQVRAQLRSAQQELSRASQLGGAQGLIQTASVLDELGATVEAESAWRRVLHAPDSTPEQRLRALGQLVFYGEPGRVVADVEWMRASGADVGQLETVREERELMR